MMDSEDHRVLGQQYDLFHFQEDSPGMPFWHPRGYVVYTLIEDFIRQKMRRGGFKEIRTPQLLPRSLWEKSGHWDHFRQNMFVVDDPDRPMALKPMSCPCHVQVFNERARSYRELPLRYAEFGACHRNEPSGSMHGLMRTRSFVQDDAHIFCRHDQVEAEVANFIHLVKDVYQAFGFSLNRVGLSLRPDNRAGDDVTWDRAEAALRAAARAAGVDPIDQPGEGAFYGPKLEFGLKDLQGREWQCGTVQLDFVLPERLDASYTDEGSNQAVPLMIHHAVLGSMERFIAILLENMGGSFPSWLAPEQIAIMPVGADHLAYAEYICDELIDSGIRAIVMKDDPLSKRIAVAHQMGIPMNGVVGRRDIENHTITVGYKDTKQALDFENTMAFIRNPRQS